MSSEYMHKKISSNRLLVHYTLLEQVVNSYSIQNRHCVSTIESMETHDENLWSKDYPIIELLPMESLL